MGTQKLISHFLSGATRAWQFYKCAPGLPIGSGPQPSMLLSDGMQRLECRGSQATRCGAENALSFFVADKQSVTDWLFGLKASDEESAHALWRRYFAKLVGLARQ